MKVHDIIPFSLEKNLGKAYNEAMALIPDGDFACIRDTDTCFLTPDAPNILQGYAERFPAAGILTCYTNRISPLSIGQLLNGKINEDSDIRNHIKLAESQKLKLYQTVPINRIISGFLMLISKDTWNQCKFSEDYKCLVVDNDYSRRIMHTGKEILCMEGLYIWHTYRLNTGIHYKEHLK